MNCRICHNLITSNSIEVKEMMFNTRVPYKYFLCPNCGCLQIETVEKDSDKLYPSNYYSFQTFKKFGILNWIKTNLIRYSVARALGVSSVRTFIFGNKKRNFGAHSLKGKITKDDRILDIGCGDGGLIYALYKMGYKHVTGIDPYLHTEIQNGNMHLLKKSVSQLDQNIKFDVIMMHHSFEHVTNPSETLKKIRSLLSKNGTCIIRIPVADSFAFEKYKCNWVQLDAPRHNFLHSNKSMEILAESNGLSIENIVDDSTSFQFVGSEQYKNGIGLNDSKSYFVPFYRKFFFNKKHIFTSRQIKEFDKKAKELNISGEGDQRIYYLGNITI